MLTLDVAERDLESVTRSNLISTTTADIAYQQWSLHQKLYKIQQHFLARDVIYTSRAYATMSVSVCLWRKCIGAL